MNNTVNNNRTHFLQKISLFVPVALCTFGLLFTSCSSSTGSGGGNGNGNGDGNGNTPLEPTFSNVQTIFSNSCGGSGCHIGETTNGVRLDSYDAVMNSVGSQYGTEIIVPDKPDSSALIDKISSNDPQFGVRMPKNQAPLPSDQISLIRDWIAEGAQNN